MTGQPQGPEVRRVLQTITVLPKQKSQHVDDPKLVGRRLKAARVNAGLSQRALGFGGCTAAYISRVEAGERIPSLQLLRTLAERLGVSADYLATGREADASGSRLIEAEVALRLDDLDQAHEVYEAVLREADRHEDQANAEAGLGQVAFRRDEIEQAIVHLERALELYGDRRLDHPAVADVLGRAYATSGRYEDGIAIYEEWLQAMRERANDIETVRFEILLANTLVDSGSYARPAELLGDALARSVKWADPVTRASMLWSQSRLHAAQKDSKLAAQYARRALEILQATELTEYTARAHQLLAFVELEQGNAAEALRLLRDGRALLGETVSPLETTKFKLEEARALAVLGESDDAGALAMETLALLNEVDPQDAGRGYQTLAGVFKTIGETERARELYELAIETLERFGAPYLVDAYRELAELLKAEGRTDEALELLEKAVAVPSSAKTSH
jgi:tetratricopeptide (TPR) repeat protein